MLQARGTARSLALGALLFLWAASAGAATPYRVNFGVDGAITGGGLVGTALFSLISVDTNHPWASELLPFDEQVKANFSTKAAAFADDLVLAAVLLPLAAQLGGGVDERLRQGSLVYG